MRMSQLFSQTLREVPAEADVSSHQLLLRAGFITQLATGIFSYLPLARQSLKRIETIIRQEIDAIGGQELTMPVVQPGDLWKESGRWYKIDAEMGRFNDRTGREMALGMTHEEVVADLVRKEIRSYRQLPSLVYQIQTKWRDDPRPRAGLVRTREFTMKDSYSLDADWEGLDRQYKAHYQAYFNIFRKCGLDVIAVGADVGMMGGVLAHEFMYLSPIGEDTLLLCEACGFSANRQIAKFQKKALPKDTLQPVEKVATPDCKTIEALANFLGVKQEQTAKAVFMIASVKSTEKKEYQDKFIFAIVRGDMEVNETKLANAINARSLRPATEEEIRSVGAEPGYASPVGLQRHQNSLPVVVVVDDLIPESTNLVSGANEAGSHLRNVNFGRDFTADVIEDICAARDGDACPNCGKELRAVRGVEVGNIFKLGTYYADSMGTKYLDQNGQEKPVIMGSYGIGLGRLLACIAEANHDAKGLCWPVSVAPFPVHIVLLAGRAKGGQLNQEQNASEQAAEDLYQQLTKAGIASLYDDRVESPGVKFNDADLIGLPLRITIGERSLTQGGVELKRRDGEEKEIAPLDRVVERVREVLAGMQAEIDQHILPVEYK